MVTIWYLLLLVLAVVVSAAGSAWFFTRKMHRKVSFMLDALEDKEINFRFSEHRRGTSLNRTLNRIRSIFEAKRCELEEHERYYGRMLDTITTGIVVIDVSVKGWGTIVYNNTAALHMLGISAISTVRQLGAVDDELQAAFERVTDNAELRCTFYNERGKITVVISAVSTVLTGRQVKIVTINDISGEIAHNEELSWNRLIRVLTHEIMNTITPIASLSETLMDDVQLAENKGVTHFNLDEFRTGLATIATSSKGLIRFVDTYRNLTHVQVPVKRVFYVRELIDKISRLVREELDNAGVTFTYVEKSDDIMLYADEDQILQILVNLVKNAIQAQATKIQVCAEIDNVQHTCINVINNGLAISKQVNDEIFVPFYTTKKEGSGIGLSLSRQIMRLHNGSLSLVRSDDRLTEFCLYFR